MRSASTRPDEAAVQLISTGTQWTEAHLPGALQPVGSIPAICL